MSSPILDKMDTAEDVQSSQVSLEQLNAAFAQLKLAYNANKQPSYSERKQVILELKSALLANREQLLSALNADYGKRPNFDSLMADILPSVQHLNYTLKHLKSWLKPERRRAGLLLAPSSIYVYKQAKGVVGVVVPWNFPVFLSIGPIVTALAAGNKVMVKLSEYTPYTNSVIRKIFSSLHDSVVVIEGGPEVAAEFTQLPFDHIFFTGSTSVGKLVAKSCAERLVPTTLELGGKSPVVITANADLEKAADAIILGKSVNAGQICVAPDYVLVERTQLQAFCQTYLTRFAALYDHQKFSEEYGAIINEAQFARLQAMLEDAKAKGANVFAPIGYEIDVKNRVIPPQLLTNVDDTMAVCKSEIFGPLLPVLAYDEVTDAIDYINSKERPLALYIMSQDTSVVEAILEQTNSGGVCVNDTLMHVGADDAPFGGIGESGLGNYHGPEGFDTFCHKRTVLKTPLWLPRVKLILQSKKLALSLLTKLFVR
ncbi:coniferyl aldehyde dehydrogenase [Pseudoalteromonas sp. G4]|uniref:coniferyl aldehyde dehydrogenase n=1 Tax=Pseudoalteromonas sp. G4 TaxID=2992761 RepID=UPI00237E671A|nr:coniferyl aldehyde dehydrogenase [Pseudoalteromonas sp. G4]MDE3273817.1 coniferyl aldehyde dehydrogenase [Pseudoalteromonas sp. G4]